MHCVERGYEPTAVAARARWVVHWKCASASPYSHLLILQIRLLFGMSTEMYKWHFEPAELVGKLSEKHIGPCHLQICSLKKQNWSAELWLEKWPLRSDICLQRIVSVVSSTVIFSQFKRCFSIIWGKKRASVQSKSSLRSFWNWAFVLTTATVA
jgi:hypothetical protein